MRPREWKIKGGLYVYDRPGGPPGNQAMNHVDGEVLRINESVIVREVLPDTVTISKEEMKKLLIRNRGFGEDEIIRDMFGPMAQNDK